MKAIHNYPLYPIGVVSELLGVHPETIRVWEKSGVVQPPQRRSGKRFYSEIDFKRLKFVHRLVQEGLTVRAIHYYLRLYPCWKTADCLGCLRASSQIGSMKPCWQEEDAYCQVANTEDPCASCRIGTGEGEPQATGTEPEAGDLQQDHPEAEPGRHVKVNQGQRTTP